MCYNSTAELVVYIHWLDFIYIYSIIMLVFIG